MADNTTLPGTGDVIGTDDVSGVKYQQVKLMDGTLNSAAVIPGSAANGLTVDVTRVTGNVATTAADGANVAIGAVADAAWTTGNGTVVGILKGLYTRLRGGQATMANSLPVVLASDQSAVTTAQATAANLNATVVQATASNLKVEPNGSVAHAAADAGNPQKMGARARSSDITAVANDNRSDLLTDLTGKLIVRPHTIPENTLSGVNSATGTGDTAVIAAQAAGVRIYVTNISVANSSAATNSIIEIKDGSTVIWRTTAPAGGGSNLHFDPPLRGTAATALNMAALTAATTIYFSVSGYKGV